MVEWWSLDTTRKRQLYIQFSIVMFALFMFCAMLVAYTMAANVLAAIAIPVGLFPVALNAATALSQRILIERSKSDAIVSRSKDPVRPKCTVAIPSIISSLADVDEAISTIRENIDRNHGETTFFCILFDLFDCQDSPTDCRDGELLTYASTELRRIEESFPAARGKLLAFSRHRMFSSTECAWIGWERKRGKIIELCRFIKDGQVGSLDVIYGEASSIRDCAYLMILDSDSWLERGGLSRLIDAMRDQSAAPRMKGSVVEAGFVIGCPRGLSRMGENTTTFSRTMFYNRSEPPTRALESTFFQDVLGHHIFVGKGLYDVSAFLASVDGRFPPERILSHDHLEGMLATPRYISDVYFYQSYPQQYSSWRERQHRWIRGDLQTLPWILFPRVRGESDVSVSLGSLDRLKLATNIAIHLTPVGQFVILITIALGGMRFAPIATLFTLLIGSPALWINLGIKVVRLRPTARWLGRRSSVRSAAPFAGGEYGVFLISLVTLADVAVMTVDAMARAGWRMIVSKRNLLEWRPTSITERSLIRGAINRYLASQLMSISVLVIGIIVAPASLLMVSPLFVAWAILPSIKHIRTREMGFL